MSKSLEKQLALTGASTDVNSVFSLRALAAQKMPQVSTYLSCHASGKPAIHASRSKTNSANSLSADGVDGSCINRRRNAP
jgi:hypothetical protein